MARSTHQINETSGKKTAGVRCCDSCSKEEFLLKPRRWDICSGCEKKSGIAEGKRVTPKCVKRVCYFNYCQNCKKTFEIRTRYYENQKFCSSKCMGQTKQPDKMISKLMSNIRSRTSNAVTQCKPGSSIKDLGCTVAELKVWLEGKFVNGMSWENYGKRGWHIDHVMPLSKFDLNDKDQYLKAVHYTNLQPLWWKENLQKSNKIEVSIA